MALACHGDAISPPELKPEAYGVDAGNTQIQTADLPLIRVRRL